jgi:hypothetical protein
MPGFASLFTRARHGGPDGTKVRWVGWRLVASCGMLLGVAAALVAPASAASAGVPTQFWVSQTGLPTGADRSCPTAAYATVQSAVLAAEAAETLSPRTVPTIELCPGTYSEQVTILKSLVLTRAPVAAGLGPVTIQLPAAVGSNQALGLSTTNCQADDAAQSIQVPQSVIEICSARPGGANTLGVGVSINDITVEGNWPTTVCYDSLYGILVGGGAALSLTNSTVEQIGAYPLNGCQGGVGVQVGLSSTDQIGLASLSGDIIETYQKNGITVDGPGSYGDIVKTAVTGDGPTPAIAQNGIQFSFGATGSVTHSTITGNNYTGTGGASSIGILVFGGGGSACGIGPSSPLVKYATFADNTLIGNDVGIYLSNVNSTCTKSATTPTRDTALGNVIQNSHGYPSADANISGWSTGVGYQAGVSDEGDGDAIGDNAISGAGYAPLGTLPNPLPPAFVRPIDIVSGPAINPQVSGNTYDGKHYNPS